MSTVRLGTTPTMNTASEEYRTMNDDDSYQPAVTYDSYDDAFPRLPGLPKEDEQENTNSAYPRTQWDSTKMSLRSSNITQVFSVPVEERRYKEMNEQQFGEKGGPQAKICGDIMERNGVNMEMSLAKDQSLTVVITGKPEAVMKARKDVVQQLQTQARIHIPIPKEHHKYILGQQGRRLADLELNTATKITIPRVDDNNENISIAGAKEGIERAKHEIQLISDERAKKAMEKIPIPKIYHPFICGPHNKLLKELSERTGARINVPPPSVYKNEIAVSGEKESVHLAVQNIKNIFQEKQRKCQTVSVEVRKTQHKYVIGPKGSGLSDILAETGVSVEVPPLDSTSETITLRGDQDKLGAALTLVYSKANSVIIEEVEAPAWLHRFIIGRSGSGVKQITADLPKVHIEFRDGQDKIIVEGPPEEVKLAVDKLQAVTKELSERKAFAEISIDQKYHNHILGRQRGPVMRIKFDTGVTIRPTDNEDHNIIRIEGTPEGVATAKHELMELVTKLENEKTRDIMIEQRFHKIMIGAQGGKIKEIRDKYNQVQITFPDPVQKSDVVTLRGPKTDVDRCYKYLQHLQQDLITSNFLSEVHIFKQFHKNIIGKGGVNIRKIRDETDTRIDLPSENNESDVIAITGKKENVEKAKKMIEDIQKELANIKEVTVEIPRKFHNSIIGAKGRLIRSVMEECGGVLIHFPSENSSSDKVIIRGPTEDVENARKQLLELANERKEASYTVEVRAQPGYHKFLIGRGGANIRQVREQTGARIIFPTSQDQDQELITIIGKKESAEKAKKELETLIKDLDNIVESDITVDPKYHRHFVARRGEVLWQIAEDFGGVTVSFPRSGVKSDKVVLKGARDCVDGAKNRIAEIVADLEAQITIEVIILQKFHRTVMGARGHKVQEITQDFHVGIKFPDRPQRNEVAQDSEEATMNGDVGTEADVEKTPRKCDIVIVTGKKENCDAAKEALLALVPITEEICVPFDFHRFIIGTKGRDVRKMMEDCDVNISIPPANDKSDIVKITGQAANVEKAKVAMKERVGQLNAEQEDRERRNFKLIVRVESKYHPKIIGRRGTVINKIRTDNEVMIQFPDRGSPSDDVITITGYEENAYSAQRDILKIVSELEELVSEEVLIDHRIHPQLIGQKGRTIRKTMDEYKVDIKFPSRESDNPDLVVITGNEDSVLDCKDCLLNLEEEYLQEIKERELVREFLHPPSRKEEHSGKKDSQAGKGYVVEGAPWSLGGHSPDNGASAPDTSSTADFPEFGASVSSTPVSWGPTHKR